MKGRSQLLPGSAAPAPPPPAAPTASAAPGWLYSESASSSDASVLAAGAWRRARLARALAALLAPPAAAAVASSNTASVSTQRVLAHVCSMNLASAGQLCRRQQQRCRHGQAWVPGGRATRTAVAAPGRPSSSYSAHGPRRTFLGHVLLPAPGIVVEGVPPHVALQALPEQRNLGCVRRRAAIRAVQLQQAGGQEELVRPACVRQGGGGDSQGGSARARAALLGWGCPAARASECAHLSMHQRRTLNFLLVRCTLKTRMSSGRWALISAA